MKIWKCTQKYYSDGTVTYNTEKVDVRRVPNNEYFSFPEFDLYVDYFVTLGELMDFQKGFD